MQVKAINFVFFLFCIQKTTTKWGGFKYRTSETERQSRAKIVALDVASSVRALLKTSTTIRKERERGGEEGGKEEGGKGGTIGGPCRQCFGFVGWFKPALTHLALAD